MGSLIFESLLLTSYGLDSRKLTSLVYQEFVAIYETTRKVMRTKKFVLRLRVVESIEKH